MTQKLIAAALVLLLASPASAVVWTGGGTDNNWSTGLNWDSTTPPGAGDTATFDNTDTQGAILPPNSIVDQDFTIANLQFRNGTSPGDIYHTVQISSGVTLSTTGFSAYSTIVGDKTNVNFVGDGKFINSAGTVAIGNTGNAGKMVTVDMSALPEVDITGGTVQILARGFYAAPTRSNSTLILGQDNTITANLLQFTGDNGGDQHLQLGTTNELKINTIQLGWGHNGIVPNIFFQSGLTNPSVSFRADDGMGATTLLMGKPSTGNGSTVQMNLTGGEVDALFQDVIIGQSGSAGGNRNGSGNFTFDKGTVRMTSAILGDGIGTGAASGTINVNGTGELTIDSLTLGHNPNAGGSTGRVNISDSGVFRTVEILTGSTTVAATREINLFGGTVGNVDGSDMVVAPEVALILQSGGIKTFDVTNNHTATFNGVISEAAAGQGFHKTGGGTLLLGGASTFTGTLELQAGILGGNGSLDGHLLVDGGTLAPGESAGTFTIESGEIASSGVYAVEIGGTTLGVDYDHLIVTEEMTLDGTLAITFINGFFPDFDDEFTVIDADSIFGKFGNVLITNASGYFDVSYINGQVILSNYQIPEPSTSMLLCLGIAGATIRRKRRQLTN